MGALDYLESDIDTPEELVGFINSIVGKVKRAKDHTEVTASEAVHLAQQIISDSENAGLQVIGWGSKNYPVRLKALPDPPLVLYVKGSLAGLSSDMSVALIGTRKPSEFGRKSAFKIGFRLAENGATVVSGLALGCDTEGHLGCLAGKGLAVAVLAHGLDTVSPAKNLPLADQIVSEGGCLVSEYALGVEAKRNHFVRRDRLQSGLSDAVIVAETGLKGGSMHTVVYSEEQNRKLACIKHPEKFSNLPSTEGNRLLIDSKRAEPLEDSENLERFLRLLSESSGDGRVPTRDMPQPELSLRPEGS